METTLKWHNAETSIDDKDIVRINAVTNNNENGFVVVAGNTLMINEAFKTIEEAENWKNKNTIRIAMQMGVMLNKAYENENLNATN